MSGDETVTSARSQTDVVIESIKDMLTRGELRPGSRLPVEKDLAAQLGVSRGSLREGVRALATLGVLETRQGDGTYVTSLDPRRLLSPLGFLADLQQPAHAADLLAVRRVLESESVGAGRHAPHDDELAELDRVLGVVRRDPRERARHGPRGVHPRRHRVPPDDRAGKRQSRRSPPSSTRSSAARSVPGCGAPSRTAARCARPRPSTGRSSMSSRAADPERARIRMAVHLLGVEEFSAAHADEDPEAG